MAGGMRLSQPYKDLGRKRSRQREQPERYSQGPERRLPPLAYREKRKKKKMRKVGRSRDFRNLETFVKVICDSNGE